MLAPISIKCYTSPGSWVLSSELWVLNQGSRAQRHGTRATTASATIITTQPPLPYIKSFDIPTTHNEYSPPTHWHFSCHGNLFRGCWWAVLFSLDFCCCYSNALARPGYFQSKGVSHHQPMDGWRLIPGKNNLRVKCQHMWK